MKPADIKSIKIKANQYLSDIEPFKTEGIPTDTIIFKTLTGCGATTLELDFQRHSIIIEPNVPVIEGKCEKYNVNKTKVLGIYEGITEDTILTYLQSDILYKKIIVTPESFYRIKDAIGQEIYKDYFLLFDECERTIQDVCYRPLITLPMHDFFLFKKKAFISATPIIPSDPRFNIYKFKHQIIKPSYKFREEITLLTTNNIILTLQEFIKNNVRERYFLFINSVDSMASVIQKLNIKEESSIYCAKESRKKLRLNDYDNVYTSLQSFSKFNFFTSRFYSAVDIEIELYKCNPTIIMLTDLVSAKHSMIDPLSEAIQLVGRFRKPHKGTIKKEIIHITNLDPSLTSMKKDEIENYLKEQHTVYKFIKRYEMGATSGGAKDTLRQMLERIDYAKFLYKHSGSKNYFMIDNLVHEEKIKGFYQSRENLLDAYRNSNHFIIKEDSRDEKYEFTDEARHINHNTAPLKSIERIVADVLRKLTVIGEYSEFHISMEIENLQFEFPKVMAPILLLGLEESKKLRFDIQTIKSKLFNNNKQKDKFGLMSYVQKNFIVGADYKPAHIVQTLNAGLSKLQVTGVKPSVKLLRQFCELSDKNNRVYMGKDAQGRDIRGYKIIRFLDNTY